MKKKETLNQNVNNEWFILIGGEKQGPFTVQELKCIPGFSPDTLVWKKGFSKWVPARYVDELQDIFKDQSQGEVSEDLEIKNAVNTDLGLDQATLTLQQDPFQFYLWILVFLLISFYAYQFLNK